MTRFYQPQLAHTSVAWRELEARFSVQIDSRREAILRALGFFEEYGWPVKADAVFDDHILREAKLLLEEIVGILLRAAAIMVDAGYKPTGSIIATLRAIRKNPDLLEVAHKIEPEALGILGQHYQRSDEPLGTVWWDITGDKVAGFRQPKPDPDRVIAAVARAIASLKRETKRGAPRNITKHYLAQSLGQIYARYHTHVGVSSVKDSRTKETGINPTARHSGPLVYFLTESVAPLAEYVNERKNDAVTRNISVDELADAIVKLYRRARADTPQSDADSEAPAS